MSVLPAPVSPVMAVRPGVEQQVEVGDDAEVDDVQLGQHLRPSLATGRRGRTWP